MTVNVMRRRLPAAATYVIALGTALGLLVLTVAAALWQNATSSQLNRLVRETSELRSHYRVLMQNLTDAETGQRGFLLTGDEDYLEPYRTGVAGVHRELAALEVMAVDAPESTREVPELRDVAERKLAELALTLELYGRGRRAQAIDRVDADIGKQLMDRARTIVRAAQDRENARLTEALAAADRGGLRLQWVIILAGALIVGVGALLVIAVRNAMAELRGARDAAQQAHERVVQEMSARVQAEDKVRQMQKMEAIGQITGGVAHDFNNMLAVILSALQLAMRRLQRREEGAETMIEAAMDGARRAAALTGRLLAFARRQPLMPMVLDVNRVLGEMSDMMRRTLGEQVDLETVLAGGLWRVKADRNELEQAILNVCVNARDAMGGSGKLTIESANAYLDEDYAAASLDVAPGQYVMIAITDTGAGMTPEVQAKAFEPFFTTKEIGKGTGLGLSHVHGFLKQSGGHVALYSEVGVGTTVKLYLPRTQDAETDTQPRARETGAGPPGDPAIVVLVVEDDERVRLLSVAALRDLGYTVLHADGGAAALDMLDANPGISLLFTDVVMPHMSGRALADEARKRHPGLKVLYTTGYTQNAIVHNGVVDAGARLLLKPYSMDDLARKVRAAIDDT